MKRCLVIGSLFAIAAFAHAGQFKSVFITNNHGPIHVLDGELMVIRNFTQENDGSTRGFVTFSEHGSEKVTVLTASIVNPDDATQGSQEVINSIVIAGPAIVNFHCGDGATCFATFKIDSN